MTISKFRKKTFCLVTGSRAEYGILRKLIITLSKEKKINFKLIVTGSHLLKKMGNTKSEIISDNLRIHRKIKIHEKNSIPSDIVYSSSLLMNGLSKVFKKLKPDLMIILGDRYEIFISAFVATLHKIPIAHICGGEETVGSYDNQFRHAISKMSHFHFVTNKKFEQRIVSMGERKKNIFNYGSLSLENLRNHKFVSKLNIEKKFKIKFRTKNFIISYHPETLSRAKNSENLKEIFKSLSKFKNYSFIFTAANADEGGDEINKRIQNFVSNQKNVYFIKSFGQKYYFSALKYMTGAIGNSSSGVIEVPSYKIGTINLGNRQGGRIKSKSIIECKINHKHIIQAIKKISEPQFTKKIKGMVNPYENKNTLLKIKNKLLNLNLKNVLNKSFYL